MDFATFWARYPKKVARADAEKAWKRLSLTDAAAAYQALTDHVALWADREKQFIPHAATWIRGRRWEDEIESPQLRVNLAPKVGSDAYYEPMRRKWELDRES